MPEKKPNTQILNASEFLLVCFWTQAVLERI